jgi:hypothetical protein
MQQNTISDDQKQDILISKIRTLAPEKIAEVEDFVDFLSTKNQDRKLTRAYNILSEKSFKEIWDNPEDDEYDRL